MNLFNNLEISIGNSVIIILDNIIPSINVYVLFKVGKYIL